VRLPAVGGRLVHDGHPPSFVSGVYGETAMARKQARNKSSRRLSIKSRWSNLAPAWQRRLVIALSSMAVIGLCVAARSLVGSSPAEAQVPNPFANRAVAKDGADNGPDQLPVIDQPQHDVMATVNGEDIRRDALATACVDRHGEEVLESLVNKRLIQHHCQNRGIEVTDQDIEAEIDRMAKRFKIGRQQWLAMLQRERGINEQQYKRDILWPTLALRKLAADQLEVSDQQVQEAYEAEFGAAVKARLIVVSTREQAEQLRRQVVDRPDDFARLAMQNSQDINSASIGGMIQPIRHHVGDPQIEREMFALQPNQITSVIPVGNQFAIFKCEGQIPPRNVPIENVRDNLVERIKEEKLRQVASDLFKKLQDTATIQNVWNDPTLHDRLPGVVATVNGEQILYDELAKECLLRYGQEVLEVEISHLLLQQALAAQSLTVTDDDLNAEIAHAAELAGVVDKQGRPDLPKWFEMATKEQGQTKEQYLRDSVWPSAALKKITGSTIQVTDEDMQRAYAANYGARVRCRAIVLGNMRRAQEVWDKARKNPTQDFFGDLAEQYSIEPSSRALRGEVPPIRRFGGQPQLEDVAFELQPDELSGIIQLGDRFVILKCEGHTEPVDVKPQEVQQILHQDIFEKKLRLAMSERFDEIRSQARIDNYLANTSQSPERAKNAARQARTGRIDEAVRPTAGQIEQ
jgi:parvulin-like peptidyl-prolyl isomerase